jgi:hypothetical protein
MMEESEKGQQPARDALLQLISSGSYRNREDNKKVDATRTIWILVTNQFKQIIVKSSKHYPTWKPTNDAQQHLLNCNFDDTEATAIADEAIAFVPGDRAPTVSQKNNT